MAEEFLHLILFDIYYVLFPEILYSNTPDHLTPSELERLDADEPIHTTFNVKF
jgi:hypothetical protein